jgi:hypothetical protein
MNADTFVMFDETLECLSTVIGAFESLYLSFCRVVPGGEIDQEGMDCIVTIAYEFPSNGVIAA